MTARRCPGCGEALARRAFDRRTGGQVDLDLCFACHAIWFDQYESAQLTPGAVIGLFRAIHEGQAAAARPLPAKLACVQCRGPLKLTQDLQRNTRISYFRCGAGHGRLSTFGQFLREKDFVRDLTATEVEKLRATVAQVRCNGCGAPVPISQQATCGYCRAPISMLDAAAVERTLAALGEAERRRTTVDPLAAMDAVLAGQRVERLARATEANHFAAKAAVTVDLATAALDFLFS